MPKRRRKRGRPATGRDPVIGVRIPAKDIRKIDQIADALSVDRSTAVRRLLLKGLDSNSWLLRTGRGKGSTGEIVATVAAIERAKGADIAVARAKPQDKPAAEIKALRAAEEADQKPAALVQRRALQRATGMPAPRPTSTPPVHRPGQARRLSADEVKAAADRAEAHRRS
jgi:hypothetical protein